MPFKRMYKKRPYGKRPKKYVKNKNLKKAVTKIVKSVNRKEAETKYVMQSPTSLGGSVLSDFVGFSQAITSSNECYRLIPNISRNAFSVGREGDVITPLSLTVKGRVSLNTAVPVSAGVLVHIFFLTSKSVKSWKAAGSAGNTIPITRLLDNGQDSKIGFGGDHYSSMMKVNKDEFTVIKHLRIHLTKPVGLVNYASTAGDLSGQAVSIEQGKFAKDFTVKIPLPARFQYSTADNDVVVQPTNYAPFMCCGWTYDDQYGNIVGNTTTFVRLTAQSHFYYQDPQ